VDEEQQRRYHGQEKHKSLHWRKVKVCLEATTVGLKAKVDLEAPKFALSQGFGIQACKKAVARVKSVVHPLNAITLP
jgi:hypothetical protein